MTGRLSVTSVRCFSPNLSSMKAGDFSNSVSIWGAITRSTCARCSIALTMIPSSRTVVRSFRILSNGALIAALIGVWGCGTTAPPLDQAAIESAGDKLTRPLPGDPAPVVRLGVIDIETGETKWMNVDTTDDSYIARLYWVGDSRHLAI